MDINSLRSYLATGNKKEFLHLAIIAEGLITFAFVICSFVVGGTANAGFNCVLTGFLNIALVGGSYYVIENSRAPIAVGFLIGCCSVMAMLNFMSAIYWGQLSHCDANLYYWKVAQYSCTNKTAYGFVSAFSVLLFLIQLFFSVALVAWRGEIINESAMYDDIATTSSYNPYEASSSGGQFSQPPPSADL